MALTQYGNEQAHHGSKSSPMVLIARTVTLISLVVSIGILRTNDADLDNGAKLTYKDLRSYRYMFYVMVVGVVYTTLQIPFAAYYMKTKKHMINNMAFLKFDFFADKVVVFMLATGVGAGFGTTMDMMHTKLGSKSDSEKFHDFLTIVYIPATFLLVGCLNAVISSIYSSLALSKN